MSTTSSPTPLLSFSLRPTIFPKPHTKPFPLRPIPLRIPTRLLSTSPTPRLPAPPAVDPWAPGGVDSQSVASQLFAVSLFPYLAFLFFLTRSNSAPKLTLFGFYFLLAFVAATIPAGIYAKVKYGTSLSNVDWLHGGAESLLTLTNLFIVLGLRGALRKLRDAKDGDAPNVEEKM